MSEQQSIIISIDDEYSLEMDSRLKGDIFLDAEGLESLVEKFSTNSKLFFELINPANKAIIILDEHLPWDEFEGRNIYEGLGRFITEFSTKPERVFIIGDSSDWAQDYFPSQNRVGKDVYTYAGQPEKLVDKYRLLSVDNIFNSQGFKNRTKVVSYSNKGNEVYEILKKLYESLKENGHNRF